MAAACPTMTFGGVTAEVWECLKAEARRQGLPVPTDHSGFASAHGAEADFRWDSGRSVLTITVTKKPDWIDCAQIDRRLRDAVRVCGGGR